MKPIDEIPLVLAHRTGIFRHREAEGISIPFLGRFQDDRALEQHGDLLEEETLAVEIVPDGALLAQDGCVRDAVDGDSELVD